MKYLKASDIAESLTYPTLFWLFMVCSVLGTIVEGLFCLIRYGRWETHTVALWGPFCIIYGIGAVILYLSTLMTKAKHIIWQFIVSAVSTTIVEYISGLLLKRCLHMKAWDYSRCFLNLNGIICLKMTIAWGLFGILFARYCVPFIDAVALRVFDSEVIQILTGILSIIMAVNLIMTILCIIRWSKRHRGYLPVTKLDNYFDERFNDEWMEHRFCEWRFLDEEREYDDCKPKRLKETLVISKTKRYK